jgi:hypothetical protein
VHRIDGAGRLRVVEQLAAQSKANYAKFNTWRGPYSYILRQYLNDQFVAQFLAEAKAVAGAPALDKAKALLQEFDSVLTFAIDVGSDAIYRKVETRRMRFLRIGTDEEVNVPYVRADDHRAIVTPDLSISFSTRSRGPCPPSSPIIQMRKGSAGPNDFRWHRPKREKVGHPILAPSSRSTR